MPKPSADPSPIWVDSNEANKCQDNRCVIPRNRPGIPNCTIESHRWSWMLRQFGFNPIVIPLPVGDFRFLAANFIWTIERKKAPNDLESSFTDGRLNTQHFLAEEQGVERLVLLIEGDENSIDPKLRTSIRNTLTHLQSKGVFKDTCEVGGVPERLFTLHRWLNEDDHSYLRRPLLPLPTQYTYTNRELRNRVQLFLCFRGLGEKPIVEALKRYTANELWEKPYLFREITPTVPAKVIFEIYNMQQREVPEGVVMPVRNKPKERKIVGEVIQFNRGVSA